MNPKELDGLEETAWVRLCRLIDARVAAAVKAECERVLGILEAILRNDTSEEDCIVIRDTERAIQRIREEAGHDG